MIQAYSPSTYPKRPLKVGKTIEKWILYLVILGIAGISLYWFIAGRGKTFEVTLTAKKGTVEYRENEKDGWKAVVSVPLKINVPSEIRTLADSEASFSTEDESIMRLGSYSRIVIAGNRGEINWVQTDGSSHHQTAKNADRKSYKVSISDGVIESQGTAFEVKVKESDTSILVFQNQVKITYKDKSAAEAKAGEEILINPIGKKTQEISDLELQESWTLNNIKEDLKNGLPIDDKIIAKAGIETSGEQQATENSDQQTSEENRENTNANINIATEPSSSEGQPSASNASNTNSSPNQTNTNTNTSAESASSTTTQTQTTSATNTTSSSVSTRKNCENSGGHWTKASNACKCPAKEVYVSSVGRCQKK